VYPRCTSHLTVVSPNSAKADARREGRKLPTIMLLTCPITALSLTRAAVARDFSYADCSNRTQFSLGARIASESSAPGFDKPPEAARNVSGNRHSVSACKEIQSQDGMGNRHTF
jgi:hypothetical protein